MSNGAELVTQREIIKTILEEEGQNANLEDIEKYEDFFPENEISKKKKKKVSVMPMMEHRSSEGNVNDDAD